MARLQRLEDLATQVRNEASSHLAREPSSPMSDRGYEARTLSHSLELRRSR